MSYDVAIIGAGADGLAAAATLAGRGLAVVVLESDPAVGGAVAGQEFHPGFTHQGLLHDVFLPDKVINGLGLRALGVQTRITPPILAIDGAHAVSVPGDVDLGPLMSWVGRIARFAAPLALQPPPEMSVDASPWPLAKTAMGLKRLGEADMLELLRIGPMCVEDFLSGYIADPTARAALESAALVGTWMGPRSPTSTAALLWRLVHGEVEPVGGGAAVVRALAEAARIRGVALLTRTEVSAIAIRGGRAAGVELSDGSTVLADAVLSTADPQQTVLELCDPLRVPPDLRDDADNVRVRGIIARAWFAVRGPVRFSARPDATVERAVLHAHPDHLERAFDDAKHRRLPRQPVLDVRVPSLSDPSLAREGCHVVSVIVHGAAFALDGGWTEQARAILLQQVQDSLVASTTGLDILGSSLVTPTDLRDRWGLSGGHLAAGEVGLDQLWAMRPSRRTARYRTGLDGLYLGGPGSHPGTHILGMTGVLAARAVMEGR